jgi:tripartite-type tricarboxylate transporter receptor subunit TctC
MVMVTPALVAAAPDYPNRSVTLIGNFPPGGSTDAMARIIRERLSQALGRRGLPVLSENHFRT